MAHLVRALLGLLCLVCAACASDVADTRVIVTVVAEATVAARTQQLQVVVTRDPGPDSRVVFDEIVEASFPYVIELSPERVDMPSAYRLEVIALRSGERLTSAQITSSYVSKQARYVSLLLSDACLGIECAADQTCLAAACLDSRVAATDLGRDSDAPPRSVDLTPGKDETSRGDASTPATNTSRDASAARDAGTARPSTDGTPAPDTSDAPDAASTSTQPPDAAAPNAAPDAATPVADPPATNPPSTTVPDSGAPNTGPSNNVPPDSGPAVSVPPDSGPTVPPPDPTTPGVPCRPTGKWTINVSVR